MIPYKLFLLTLDARTSLECIHFTRDLYLYAVECIVVDGEMTGLYWM